MLQCIQYDGYHIYVVINSYMYLLYDIDYLIGIININIKSLMFIIHGLI